MPEKETLRRVAEDKRRGKSPSTQAGEFIREEIHHIREGKHGARSPQQAILRDVAKMMLECDCGEIPVVDSMTNLKPIGVVTDRDIVCRTIAQDKNPMNMSAKECMSKPCITVDAEAIIEDCCSILKRYHIRRAPVVDEEGYCCGMFSQADLVTHNLHEHVVGVLHEVYQKS